LADDHHEPPAPGHARVDDRRIAADHAREEQLGLKFGRVASAQAEPAVEVDPENRELPMRSEENAA
jgi:hypothetical protein